MSAPISLRKDEPAPLQDTSVVLRINWALASHVKGKWGRKPVLDLDASAVGLDASNDVIAFCFHGFTNAAQGSVRHFGDVKAKGSEDWANEAIGVDLPGVPSDITTIVFVLNSYKKANFADLGEAYAEVLIDDRVVARASLSLLSSYNAYTVVKFCRAADGWSMTSLNTGSQISSNQDAVKLFAQQVLSGNNPR